MSESRDPAPEPEGSPETAGVVTECFLYRLRPGCGEAYEKYHREASEAQRRSLRRAGYLSYDIYRRGEIVISVVTRDLSKSGYEPTESERAESQAWTAKMAPLFAAIADEDGRPLTADHIFWV